MTDQNKWKEMSEDISDISKKIKNNLSSEQNIDDLKDSIKAIKENVSGTINNLIDIIENTVN
mgnify:FL=1